MNNQKLIKLSIATILFAGLNVFAKDDVVSLDAVSVTATVSGTNDVDSFKANVRNATLIKDMLRDIPGVYMSGTNGYNQKIYMRGMNDRGLNVTIDGARQKGNTFHHNADLLIDPAIIKSVDVGIGVHSVVGTSGAMGGSVAFETVDAADLLEYGETIGARLRMGYSSNNDEFSQGITIYGSDEDRIFDALGYFNHRGYDFGEDGEGRKIGGDGDDYNYLLKLGIRLGDYGRLEGSYEHMEYKGNYPMKAEWPGGVDNKTGLRNLKESEYLRDTFTLNYTYNPNDYVDLDINAYYTEHNLDMTKEDPFGINTGVKTWGGKAVNKTKFQTGALNHTLVYGTEYYTSSSYNDTKRNPKAAKTKTGNSIGVPDDETTSLSLFIEDQMRYGGLTIVPGVRFDYYELETIGGKKGDPKGRSNYDWNEVSPAILVDYQTEFGLGMYASYAKLFRGPDVYEGIRLNDKNAKAAYDAPLDAETGNAYEVGLRYMADISDNSHISLSAKYFYTDYENLIAEMSEPGSAYSTRLNTGDATIKGYELAAKLFIENLTLGASYSSQNTDYDVAELAKEAGRGGKSVYGSTLAYGDTGDKITFNAEYFVSPLDMFIGWNTIAFTGIDEYKDGTDQKIDKPGYAVHDVYATWVPNSGKFKGLELNFGVYNIFDKTYASHNQRTLDFSSAKVRSIDWEEGRNVKFNVSYKF